MMESLLESSISTAYFQHSILYVILKPGCVIGLQEAEAQMEAWREMSNEIKNENAYGLCIDLTGIKSITKEARLVYAKGRGLNNVGVALLITSPYVATVANLSLRLRGSEKSIRIFFSRNKAENWLRKRLKNQDFLVA